MASQLSSQASQDTEDGLAAALNGVALSASQNEDFDEEEDDYESSQTEEIQETIASEQKNEFVMKLDLENMLADYLNKSDVMDTSVCAVLATAMKLEDFRMVCLKLDPNEFPKLVVSATTLTSFHYYLNELDPHMRSYPVFSQQVRTIRALIVKNPEVLGSIPLHDAELMATTLFENFRIKTMTAAMTLTLTEEQKLEAVERAKALKTSNIAKKKLIAQAAVEETAGRGLGGISPRISGVSRIQNRAEEEVDDVFYTPAEIAVMMVEMAELKPGDIVLEPCRGGGIIYKLIPDYCTKEWCEVAEGRDFLEYTGRPTHIITNPPFSLFTKFVIKMIELKPQTITLLFGCMNIGLKRINRLIDAGYTITKQHHTWWKPIPFAFTVIIQFELLAEPRDTADLTYDYTLHN